MRNEGVILIEKNKTGETAKKDKFLFYGLLAASFTSALAILSKDSFSTPLIIATCFFAAAIPALSLMVLMLNFSEQTGYKVNIPWLNYVSAAALGCSHFGFVALFWSVSWISGVIALISVVTYIVLFLRLDHLVSEVRNKANGGA